MQRYLRINSLEQKLADIKKKNASKVAKYQHKCSEIKENSTFQFGSSPIPNRFDYARVHEKLQLYRFSGLMKVHLMRKNGDTNAELSIYKVRLDEIVAQKWKEIEADERIKKATPIVMNVGNCDVSTAVKALSTALSILTEHYQCVNPYDRYEGRCYQLIQLYYAF